MYVELTWTYRYNNDNQNSAELLLDDILETRRTAMETSLRQLSSAVRLVISRGTDQVTPKPLTIPCDKKICWDLVVGSFLREIDEKGLEFLIKSDGELPDDISINTMLEKIRTLAITVPKTSANMPGDIHYGSKPEVCPGFVTSGENIKGSFTIFVLKLWEPDKSQLLRGFPYRRSCLSTLEILWRSKAWRRFNSASTHCNPGWGTGRESSQLIWYIDNCMLHWVEEHMPSPLPASQVLLLSNFPAVLVYMG